LQDRFGAWQGVDSMGRRVRDIALALIDRVQEVDFTQVNNIQLLSVYRQLPHTPKPNPSAI
jgi:hypothetical protein